MAASTTKTAFKIGIIIGSQRVVRIGPQVATFVTETLHSKSKYFQQSPASPKIDIAHIDIAKQGLPFFDEPGVPQYIKSAEGYANTHSRSWSQVISSHDAFIFITSQRNFGVTPELKNAIDYLYWEWASKPAMIVSYGGHGGEQSAEQLRTILERGVKMAVEEKGVAMKFPSGEFIPKALGGQDVGLDGRSESGHWAEHREAIVEGFERMVGKLVDGKDGSEASEASK